MVLQKLFSKKNRALLRELVATDFKLRYQGSILGYTWSLLRPLFMFAILYVVFVVIFPLGRGIPHYPVYLFMGLVMWNFFADMTNQSLGSVVGRGDLIRKIRIPRWMIVFSSSVSALINLALNLVVVGIFMALNHVQILPTIAWFPLILLEVYVFALGISLFLSALFVRFRDVGYIWEVFLQAGFYATPILYPLSKVTNVTIQKVMFLNPLAQSIQDGRYAVISHDPVILTISRVYHDGWYRFIPFVIVTVILIGGLLYFKKESKYFAENI